MTDFVNADYTYKTMLKNAFTFHGNDFLYVVAKVFFLLLSPVLFVGICIMYCFAAANILIGKLPLINLIYGFIIGGLGIIFTLLPYYLVKVPDYVTHRNNLDYSIFAD